MPSSAEPDKLSANQPHSGQSTAAQSSLAEIRAEISEIDHQLLTHLSRRRELSKAVAVNKLNDAKPVRDQQRERQLLDSLIEKGCAMGLAPHYVTRLFHAIIEDSVMLQQNYLQQHSNPQQTNNERLSVALLGGKGAYSYLAANQYFSAENCDFLGFASFKKVIESVIQGQNEFGVLPIENTTSGGITEVYDLLLQSDLTIVGEVNQPIQHCLLAKEGTPLTQITQILAHPEASQQCSRSLAKMTQVEVRLVSSTAEALRLTAKDDTGRLAAIGGEKSADFFGLHVISRNMANLAENTTRFIIVATTPRTVSPQVNCKTSVILSTGQKPGSLAEILLIFRDARLPLTKLESRPIPGTPWQQMFYIDFEGNIDDPTVAQSLEDIRNNCHFLKVLGSYPSERIKPTRVSPTEFYRPNDES